MNRALPRQLRMLVVNDEIDVDLFAGGGGFSEGFQRATGVPPMVAVNHDADAIRMHEENHPETQHYQEDVFAVDPVTACRGRPVRWLHGSPDCTHFSRAKGGKPKDKNIRGLAWVLVKWAEAVRPRIISLENVAEFTTWGPLGDDGQPIKARAGETFREFRAALEALGYAVEFRTLNAADFGAPTSRKRLFMVARRDGQPIAWPEPTHGPGRAHPWRTAAECIDWSIPCPSIFTRAKPLAEATQRRIAEGIRRYVLECKSPFLLTLTHGGRLQPLTEPMRTVTAAHRGEHALVTPFVSAIDNTGWGTANLRGLAEPLSTVTKENRHALVAPVLVQAGYGEREGQAPRALDLGAPLGTVVAGGSKHALAAAFLTRFYGTSTGAPLQQPAPTVADGHGYGHTGLVAAFLTKFYGEGGQWCAPGEPLHTVVGKDRFGLVQVTLDGTPYVITDIGLRMLQPRELARAQGFPDSYVLTGTKTSQVARLGNSVVPHVAEALVRANLRPTEQAKRAA